MYEAKLELRTRPFGETDDPPKVFWSQAHRLAFDRLCFAAKSRAPLTLFAGEQGAGRTVLARELLVTNIPDTMIGLIASPGELGTDVCAALLKAFEPERKLSEVPDLNRMVLTEFLHAQIQAGRAATIVVDDADLLSREQLSALCFFAGAQSSQRPQLKLVLIGLPELSERLSIEWPDLAGPSFMLESMSKADTVSYVNEKLNAAGAKSTFFDENTLDEIYLQTKGVPHSINVICEGCLKQAATQGAEAIDRSLVKKLANMYRTGGLIGAHIGLTPPLGTPVAKPVSPPVGGAVEATETDSFDERPVKQVSSKALLGMIRTELRRFGLTPKRSVLALVLASAIALVFAVDPDSPIGIRVSALVSGMSATWQDVVSGTPASRPAPKTEIVEVNAETIAIAEKRVTRIGQTIAAYEATAEDQFRAALDIGEDTADAAVVAYARAALLGHERAAYYLGQIYETGEGVPVDLLLAKEWYKMSGSSMGGAVKRLMELPATRGKGELGPPIQLFSYALGGGGSVELVWTSALGMDPSHYRVELSSRSGIIALSVQPISISAIRLTRPDGALKWRVVAIDDESGEEAISPWLDIRSK